MKLGRVVLAGGGTAGHVNPLLATADELRSGGSDIRVIGTEEGLEKDLVPAAGYRLISIPKAPIPRRPSVELFRFPGKLSAAVKRAKAVIAGSDVVVGFGGYVAAPAYVAAKSLGVPFVVHEQNAKPGWANKLGAKNAAAVGLTFRDTELYAKQGFTEVTGMPLRRSIVQLGKERETGEGAREARVRAAQAFGLDPDLPTLLITGGSQGAAKLNSTFASAAADFPAGVQVLHVAGAGKAKEVLAEIGEDPVVPWVVKEYLEEMDRAFALADLVVSRAGAGAVSELMFLGIPSVYVPFPIGNGEQALNARDQVEAGGALLVDDEDLDAGVVSDVVIPLLLDPEALSEMAKRSRAVSPGDGAKNLVRLIEVAT